jgi:hypothetical protein
MLTNKLRTASMPLLTIIVLAAGGFAMPRGAQSDPPSSPAVPKVPKELLEKRLVVAKKVWDLKLQSIITFGLAVMPPFELLGWSERLLEAELALADKKEDQLKALQGHVDRAREVERVVGIYTLRGAARESDVFSATYERLNAVIRYFEATGKLPSPTPKGKDEGRGELPPAKEIKRQPGKRNNQP